MGMVVIRYGGKLMKQTSFITVMMVYFGMLLPLVGVLAQNNQVTVVARISAQLPAKYNADLKNLVTEFAVQHGFSKPVGATMPRNRKIFYKRGSFSLMFRASDNYYLLMHNVHDKDCILIDLYASQADAKYQKLLAELSQSVQDKFKQNVKVLKNSVCENAL